MVKKLHSNKRVIKLKCIKCKQTFQVRTTAPEIYTDEIKNKWKCINCAK